VAGATSATAEQNQLAPLVFSGRYESQLGAFSHWSAVVQKDSDGIEVEYAVCNFDKTTPLIYRWIGPNIRLGDGGALPVGKCHILKRDVAAIDHDRNAFIEFTQAARKHPAPAHLSKPYLPTGAMPRVLVHIVRTFYGPESIQVEPSLANLIVTQHTSGDRLYHYISWTPPTVKIAMRVDAFGGTSARDVIGQANRAGYQAEISNLQTALAKSSLPALPADRLSEPVVVIGKSETAQFALELKFDTKVDSLLHSYISLIDAESKKLVTDFEISSFAKK
jgi:hypothetical protein